MFDPEEFTIKIFDEVYKKAAQVGIDPLDDRFEIYYETKYDEKNHSYRVEAGLRPTREEYKRIVEVRNNIKKFEFKYGV